MGLSLGDLAEIDLEGIALLETCPACKGAREVQGEAYADFVTRFGASALDYCWDAERRIFVREQPDDKYWWPTAAQLRQEGVSEAVAVAFVALRGEPDVVPCGACSGTGTVLTEVATQLLVVARVLDKILSAAQARQGEQA